MPTVVAKLAAQKQLAKLIRAEVTQKAGGDGGLNPSEQKGLSPYLREVAVEMRSTPWSKVDAEQLIDRAMQRAMKTWTKVNDKGPSRLSEKELAALKSEDPALAKLTDKAVKAALAAKAKPDPVAPLALKTLPASTKLAQFVDEKDTEWHDDNITNGGSTRIFGHKVKLSAPATREQLEHLAAKMFGERAAVLALTPAPATNLKVASGKLSDKAIADTGAFAMRGFDYAPGSEALAALRLDVKQVAAAVGPSAQVIWASVSGEMKGELFEDTNQAARLTVFMDKKSGQLAAFWVVEGFM